MPYKNPEDKKKRIQERRKKWLEDGFCTICGKEPLIADRCYGLICKQKMLDRRKQHYESDLIVSRKKSRDAARKRSAKCLEQGVCYCCNAFIDDGVKRCQSCIAKERESRILLTQKRFNKRLCIKCGEHEFVSDKNKWCKNCYLKHMSRLYLGNKTQGKLLQELLDKQDGVCPYTGLDLFLGKNTSLDHICAKSCGGDCNITNLQWVYSGEDFCVNMMKRDCSHDFFIKAIKTMAAHLNESKKQ